jgi:phenylacetate-CoA ligase
VTIAGRARALLGASAIRARARAYADPATDGEREATQLRLLNQEWRRVVLDVPYYASLRADRGLSDRFESFEEFVTSVPATTRALVQKDGLSRTSVSRHPDLMRMTGGSTAEPIQIPGWKSEGANTWADTWWGRSWYGVTPASRLFLLWGHSHLLGVGARGWLRARKRELSDWLLGYHRFSAYDLRPEKLRRAARILIRFRPDYMIGYSVALDLFARANLDLRTELRAVGLKTVVATAESFPSPESSALLGELFDCPVAMEYGATETGLVAHTNPSGIYRVFWRSYFVEAELDGAARRVRVTSLYPRCFPLVRYEIGDEVAVSEPAPRTALGLTTFERVIGRCNDYVVLSDGATIHSEVFSHALRPCSEIHGFQVVQSEKHLRIRFTSIGELPEEREREILARLAKAHPDLALATLERVATLEQTIAGKTRMVVR